MGTGLGGGGLAAGQALVAPHAIPGPLPTVEPALPNLSHPQHSHTTTTTQPHPTATLPQPAPPTIYSIAQKILHICFPAVREFLQCNYTPGRQRPEANLLEFAASPIPHSPLQCCLAGGQAAVYQSPWSPEPPPRDCQQSGSESQGLRVCSPPCSEHPETLRPRERKGTPGIAWARPALPPPTLAHFPVHENSAHPLPRTALARGLDFASYGFQKSSLSSPVLHLTMQCWIYAARCQWLSKLEHQSPNFTGSFQVRSGLLPMVGAQESCALGTYLPLLNQL